MSEPSATAGETVQRVTREELAAFLDWHAAVRALMREVKAGVEADPDPSLEEFTARVKRHSERAGPAMEREPFKNSKKGKAMREVLEAFYVSGSFFRDEEQPEKLRASHGKALIDSIANQEALFREKLDP